MNGTPSALAPQQASDGAGNPISPSLVNSYRINAVAERLASHVQLGYRTNPDEFYQLCLSLSRGIDYALANGEIPDKVRDLPTLMKQICQRKNDEISQAAVMVLMISVKNACKIGWFQRKESEELITSADEMGKIYCSMGNVNTGPSSCDSTIPTIMERFYPRMKLGRILASVEAKPGYGASTIDFHITKSTVLTDKIWLLVAQTDNIETSACLISPQQVNFLLNGKGVDKRTNVLMDTGPQMPTNVTGMLKFGTNLLQAVGQFNGHYVILAAYMSVTSSLEHPVQDFVQPAVTSVDSDSDIIEGPSQISLNCPISFTRIKTPVKGRSCKHFQCFDFDNFININSRRPSWRCPHCNQSVSYSDIRLDRNMVEVLKDVGENVAEVIVHADGSWKAVLENDHNVDKIQKKAHNCEKEQTEPQESTYSLGTLPDVLDLTNDDDQMEIMDTFETADRKPFQASAHDQFVTPNSTSLGMNSAGVNQNVAAQIDDFWSGLYLAHGRTDTPIVGVGVPEHPTLPDTVSPAFNQEVDGHDNNSVMHNQFSAPNNMQLQLNYNSAVNEYGRSSSIPRHISRTPVAVQALPVQPQALGVQQNSITNLNSLLPSSSPATPHVSLSNASSAERQQQFSRSPMIRAQVSGVTSSSLQRRSATQNRVSPFNMPAPSQLPNPYRATGLFSDYGNPHLQQALNPQATHPMRSSNIQQSHIQQSGSLAGIVQVAGATASSQQAWVTTAAQVARQSSSISVENQTDSIRGLTGEKRGNVGGQPQSVSRTDDLFNLPSEQNWRPTARMRGSLDGKELSDDLRQRIIAPTAQNQSPRLQGPQPVRPTQPVQSSRPHYPPTVRPTQGDQSSRPLLLNSRR